jgi:glycosyltransferase involved in cell wall biosynthesis
MVNKKMNILHLTKDYIYLNGVTTFIKFLILNNTTNKYFIASNYITDGDKSIQDQNISKQYLSRGTFQFIRNIKQVVNICKKNKIDIIHSHHRYYDLLAYIVSKIYPVKTITTVHSKVYGKKILSYKAEKIVVVGKNIKQHLIQYFGVDENKISVINNFIDPIQIKISKSKEEVKKELQVKENYIVGYVGRFDIAEKGIDILIKAIPLLIEKEKDIIFVFIGDGKDKKYLVNNTRKFKGNIRIIETKKDIYNYMQVFDQIILPSRIDPFPLVMLEAAYMKIPFIGGNVDGISEFINDGINGLLFAPEDHVDLSNKIISLINDKDKAKILGERLHQKVINNFTSDVIVPQYEKLYSSILGKK